MKCNFPSPCWFAIHVQNVGGSYNPIYSSEEVTTSPTYLDTFNEYWDMIYEGWQNRPEVKSWWSNTPYGLLANAIDEIINLQIEALNHIRHGGAENKNLYTDVERDRVDSIGTDIFWIVTGMTNRS